LLPPLRSDFRWVDAERLIRFGPGAAADAPALLRDRGFDGYALLTTERAQACAPALADGASTVVHVPAGPVPEAAAAVRGEVGGRPLVALGGGRVIDVAKAIAGADGGEVAALPTTLSGAELTRFHRMPAGVDQWRMVRPSLIVADPALMASQPMPQLAGSAMNALAHAIEALYTPLANPVAEIAGLEAARLIAEGLGQADPDRERLALGGVLAGWATGSAGYAFIHVLCQTTVRVAGTPHASTYAVMLPHGLRLLEPRVPDLLARVAEALGAGEPTPELAAARAAHLGAQAHVTRLAALGVEEHHIAEIADQASQRAELANTPDPPDRDELEQLLRAALG
jgi:alcohol dehydrogenase class IV